MIRYDDNILVISALQKGDYISVDIIRQISGLDPYENSDLYRLYALALRNKIISEKKVFVRFEGYALRVLTDIEAVYYEEKRFKAGQTIQESNYKRSLDIDESNLDEMTKDRYRKSINQQSRILGATQQEFKKFRIEERQEKMANKHLEKDIQIIKIGDKYNAETDQSTRDRTITLTSSQRITGESEQSLCAETQGVDQQKE